jgi:hypothetical protein
MEDDKKTPEQIAAIQENAVKLQRMTEAYNATFGNGPGVQVFEDLFNKYYDDSDETNLHPQHLAMRRGERRVIKYIVRQMKRNPDLVRQHLIQGIQNENNPFDA